MASETDTPGTRPTNAREDAQSPAAPEDVFRRLDALGIPFTTVQHRAIFTVEESKAFRGDNPGAHCKALFLKDKKGAMFLVVTLEDRRLDLKALEKRIGSARLSFASPERLRETLGVEPGSVTPFALINDSESLVSVILDRRMMAAPLVNYHPLVNTASSALTPQGLLRFIADCGHEPRITDLDARTEKP